MEIVSIIFRCHERDEVRLIKHSILRYFRKYDDKIQIKNWKIKLKYTLTNVLFY